MEADVKYIIGYPGWDSKRSVKVLISNGVIRIKSIYPKGDIYINAKDIIDISFDAKSKRSGTRAATGALIGGVLTGGIGLLAGAAIGAAAKDKSEIFLKFKEGNSEREVLLLTKDKTNLIYNEIKGAYDYALQHSDEDLVKKAKESGELMTIDEKPVENPVGFTIFLVVFVVVVLALLFAIFI
jgi:hypothetical protein